MLNEGTAPILSIKNLKKTFGQKTVVNDVSFDVFPGEIITLVGENGAGKSTLKNMLCGLLEPTDGEILIDGKAVKNIIPMEHGISAVHQELSLFPSLSVAANICISSLPGRSMNVNWKKAEQIAKKQLDFLGMDIEPKTIVETLGTGKQQIVEIGKALLHSDRLLILDEPTTSLTSPEREKLFCIMDMLRKQGVAIIFISHFMDEVMRMGDKYIVLRDGFQVGTGLIKDIERLKLEELMVGRTIGEMVMELGTPQEEEALRVENLSSYDFADVSFSVKKGEIIGLSGLIGAGRTEVVEAIMGLRPSSGKVFIDGKDMTPVKTREILDSKVAFVTEDRKVSGIFPNRSVRENISAADIRRFLDRKIKGLGFPKEEENTRTVVKERDISIPHIESKITNLSGGNQQKVIIGRWLATQPEIVILDEPTKGVDIGAKSDIHEAVAALARKGVAVILASSDLPELLQLSHRVLVMRTGHVVGEFKRDEFDSVKIISLAASSVHEQ
ncbi:MAG: sugar ABC transporter ATP-binding protein [Spirochaetales bacterium]|uniref:Sugar ABC transporter ATP-binding protein n=1 Tax=Candidatus Thalassospirochaeta sargassi TaxID=3119039 RepID=A0AAJ1IET1_9SPIO|nr:sugar ABC transporter ATP-binding protein [Spirochaetales bacterium]